MSFYFLQVESKYTSKSLSKVSVRSHRANATSLLLKWVRDYSH